MNATHPAPKLSNAERDFLAYYVFGSATFQVGTELPDAVHRLLRMRLLDMTVGPVMNIVPARHMRIAITKAGKAALDAACDEVAS